MPVKAKKHWNELTNFTQETTMRPDDTVIMAFIAGLADSQTGEDVDPGRIRAQLRMLIAGMQRALSMSNAELLWALQTSAAVRSELTSEVTP